MQDRGSRLDCQKITSLLAHFFCQVDMLWIGIPGNSKVFKCMMSLQGEWIYVNMIFFFRALSWIRKLEFRDHAPRAALMLCLSFFLPSSFSPCLLNYMLLVEVRSYMCFCSFKLKTNWKIKYKMKVFDRNL